MLIATFIFFNCMVLISTSNENFSRAIYNSVSCYPGDVNIFVAHEISSELCDNLNEMDIQVLAALGYGLEQVNRNPRFMFSRYNFTLGYTLLTPCGSEKVRTAALPEFTRRLLPAWKSVKGTYSENSCERKNKEDELIWFASAILGCWCSSCTELISSNTQFLSLPILGTESSSDSLSLKSEHPFVARMVAKDSYQSHVVVDLLEYFNWTYIAVVYTFNEYQNNLAINLRKEILKRKSTICIAYMPVIDDLANMTAIENKLIENLDKVKAIVAISSYQNFSNRFMEAMEKNAAVFIFFDNTYNPKNGSLNQTVGSFYVTFQRSPNPQFIQWYNNRSTSNINAVPYGYDIWKSKFNCCITEKPNCNTCNLSNKLSALDLNSIVIPADRIIDAFAAYGHAMSTLAFNKCLQALTDRDAISLNRCLVGDELYQTLLNVSFQGVSGKIFFDNNGDAQEQHYTIYQQQKGAEHELKALIQVASWDIKERLNWSNKLIWRNSTDPPLSICSRPCPPRHYKLVQTECCWICQRCRENERIIENNEGCATCPPFHWPSDSDGRICRPISVSFTAWYSLEAVVAIVLSIFGIVSTCITAAILFKWRHTRLIKACSLELSLMTLFGILEGYIAMFLFLGQPSLSRCAAQLFVYNISLTGAYAPLFIKTQRIYRVFAASAKGHRPNHVSTRFVVINACIILSFAVIITSSLLIWTPPQVVHVQPDQFVPFVEIYCPHQVMTFLLPLSINLVLVLLCAVLAFKTRALPENFHDSKCIFACTTCCMFLWMAFVPSVMTSRSGSTENVLLSFSVFVNSSVMLASLFGLKVYAVVCQVDVDDQVKFYGGTHTTEVKDSNHKNEFRPNNSTEKKQTQMPSSVA